MRIAMWAVAWLIQSAPAAQMEVSRAELCAISDLVVVGEVTSMETRWSSHPQGGIERLAWVHALEPVRGPVPETVEVVLPGGRMGELRHRVEDVPDLRQDVPYLLFLRAVQGRMQVIGGEQGAVPVAVEPGAPGEPLEAALTSVEGCADAR